MRSKLQSLDYRTLQSHPTHALFWEITLCIHNSPGHDVKLHPSSATGNQQSLCAGPKPGQNEEGLSDGWRYTDRKNQTIEIRKNHDTSDMAAQMLQGVMMWCRHAQVGQDRPV